MIEKIEYTGKRPKREKTPKEVFMEAYRSMWFANNDERKIAGIANDIKGREGCVSLLDSIDSGIDDFLNALVRDSPQWFPKLEYQLQKTLRYGIAIHLYLTRDISLSDNVRETVEDMADLYERKNADYGNAFEKSIDRFGLQSVFVRIGDKVNRAFTLLTSGNSPLVEEKIADTLLDMANYAVLTQIYINKQKSKKNGTE